MDIVPGDNVPGEQRAGKVEVIRAARRLNAAAVPAAPAPVSLIPLGGALMEEAADTGEPPLRTLDAIHLASALTIRSDLTAFVAYDHRLVAAAEATGITAVRPPDTGSR